MDIVKQPIYHNWKMFHPDGFLMCLIQEARAKNYLKKDLADQIGENEIKLKFQPNGLGHAFSKEADFFLVERQNICYVCGTDEELTRHHLVPQCFRRHFIEDINKRQYDIIPVCRDCHLTYEQQALKLKKELAREYRVEIQQSPTQNKLQLWEALNACNALVNFNGNLPDSRRKQLEEIIGPFTDGKFDKESLDDFYQRNKYFKLNDPYSFCSIIASKIEDKKEFILRWRKHFIDVMQPQFMPKSWVVDYFPTLEVEDG